GRRRLRDSVDPMRPGPSSAARGRTTWPGVLGVITPIAKGVGEPIHVEGDERSGASPLVGPHEDADQERLGSSTGYSSEDEDTAAGVPGFRVEAVAPFQ